MSKTSITRFLQLRALWLKILSGDHSNSVRTQLTDACRDATFIGTLTELQTSMGPPAEINAQLYQMFRLGYSVRQSLAIRRLVDWGNDVHSLARVIKSMKANRELLTRKNVICYDGCPFDPAEASEKWQRSVDHDSDIGDSGDLALLHQHFESDRRHQVFDRLSEQGSAGRGDPHDQIAIEVFDRIDAQMRSESIVRVKNFVNKFVAHADDTADRKDPRFNPQQQDITHALRTLCDIHAFLTAKLINESSISLVPIPQYDNLRSLDQPWVAPEAMVHGRKIWARKAAEVDSWTKSYGEQFCVRPALAN